MSQKNLFSKKNIVSGGRTVCSKRLSFSQFVVLISTTNCEKDSLLGQTILPPEPITFFGKRGFFDSHFNADPVYNFNYQQGKQCFQRWNRCVRFKVVRLSSLIPWDLRCPCSNLIVYRRLFFVHPLCVSRSCLQYGISFGHKKPDNVDRDYIVLLSNPIEEGTVQCIVEKLDLVTGNTAGQDGDTLVMR